MGLPQGAPTVLLEDNASCIKMAHAPASAPTQNLHHIDGKFHCLGQQVVCDRTIRVAHVPTAEHV